MTFDAPDTNRSPRAAVEDGVSLHDIVLVQLRAYLADGGLGDGDRIPERDLCALLGISRTPLREGLKVLAAEGLIELLPNRGARVRRLSAADVDELFDLMGGYEALAGRLAAERITDEAIAEIETLHHTMYAFYLHRDMTGYARVNREIHHAIVEAAGNAALSEAYRNIGDRIGRTRYSARLTEDRGRWAELVRDHEDILDLLRRREGAALAETLFRHLRHKQEAAIAALERAPVDQ